jgi:hypothetical protein
MLTKPRVYISAPVQSHLTDEQRALKSTILQAIEDEGFDLQIFHERGIPKRQGWSFSGANELMGLCHGAAVLAFAKWRDAKTLGGEVADLPSEFNHFEGALAIAHNVPLLLVTDHHVRTSGITYTGGGLGVYFWPDGAGADWAKSKDFREYLRTWSEEVINRRKVFLGYCGHAKATADAVTLFIERTLEEKVLNYAMDFRAGPSILEQVEAAASECSCALLLFTRDDEIGEVVGEMAPRDNVVFEAGYFLRAKGKKRVALIREEGAKVPADLGGIVYIPLNERNNISPIETKIRDFLKDQL